MQDGFAITVWCYFEPVRRMLRPAEYAAAHRPRIEFDRAGLRLVSWLEIATRCFRLFLPGRSLISGRQGEGCVLTAEAEVTGYRGPDSALSGHQRRVIQVAFGVRVIEVQGRRHDASPNC